MSLAFHMRRLDLQSSASPLSLRLFAVPTPSQAMVYTPSQVVAAYQANAIPAWVPLHVGHHAVLAMKPGNPHLHGVCSLWNWNYQVQLQQYTVGGEPWWILYVNDVTWAAWRGLP